MPEPESPADTEGTIMRDIRTTVMGNATADADVIQRSDGSTSAKVRIAVTSRYYDSDKDDYTDRKTEFITVWARRALARNVLRSVKKGQPLIVTGRLSSQEWTDDSGTQRFNLSINADAIGHDLTFGTTNFVKSLRQVDTPDIDEQTGEIIKPGHQNTDGVDFAISREDADSVVVDRDPVVA